MSAAAGIVAGALGVVVLEAAVKHPGNAGTALSSLSGLASRFLDPSVPAIPQLGAPAQSAAQGAVNPKTGEPGDVGGGYRTKALCERASGGTCSYSGGRWWPGKTMA